MDIPHMDIRHGDIQHPDVRHCEPGTVVSRHSTSEGEIVYTRCRCGRLQVCRDGAELLRSREVPTASTGDRRFGTTRRAVRGRAFRFADLGGVWWSAAAVLVAVLVVAVLVAVALAVLPPPAVAMWVVLGSVVGALAVAWGWVTGELPGPGGALRATAGATVAGLVLAGLMAVAGPLTVPTVVGCYALAVGSWLWRRHPAG